MQTVKVPELFFSPILACPSFFFFFFFFFFLGGGGVGLIGIGVGEHISAAGVCFSDQQFGLFIKFWTGEHISYIWPKTIALTIS